MGAFANNMFSNMPEKDPLEFGIYKESLDYKKVIKFLDFNTNELSKIGGISKSSVRNDEKAPQILRDRLKEIAIICSLVAEYFAGDPIKTALWFKTPNPMLGDITPRDMIRLGRSGKLIRFIMEAKAENGEEEKSTK